MYVGALTALLDMDFKVVEGLITQQYRGKDKLIASNLHALKTGYEEAQAAFACPIGLRVEHSDMVGDRIFVNGNDACGLGAVYAAQPLRPGIRLRRRPLNLSAVTAANTVPIRITAWPVMRSFSARTNWHRLAWSSARRGMAHAPLPRRPAPASR